MMTRRLLKHIICWALFILYEVSLDRYMGDKASLLEFGCFYILDIALFYFNALVILRKFLAGNSFLKYVGVCFFILLELTIYSYISVILNNAFKGWTIPRLFSHVETAILVTAAWRGIYFIALSGAYFAVLKAIKAVNESNKAKISELNAQNKNEKLEKDIVILQNAYLQAQINPHFLFNTLNFIYNQAEEGNPDTAKNISLLSEIMQYSLTTLEKDGKVPLCQEINQIKRYLCLNLSRFDNTLFLLEEISVEEDAATDARIPPLILLTFVENVFKHGDMTNKEFPATIKIAYSGGLLIFSTKNRKRKNRRDNRKHVGLKNAFMRLNDSYPKECIDSSTNDNKTDYEFTLKLKL